MSLEDERAVGADVAEMPSALAGEDVGKGESIMQADKVPGAVTAPCVHQYD